MPRYFFHVSDGSDLPDLHGTVLPDLGTARREAVRYAGALLVEDAATFWASGEWTMRVTDDSDMTLFELLFVATDSPAIGGGIKVGDRPHAASGHLMA